MSNQKWTPEEVSQMGDLIFAGLTSNEIAIEMGKTRSTICAKIDRLRKAATTPREKRRWTLGAAPGRRAGRPRAPVQAMPRALAEAPVAPVSLGLTLMDLEMGQCKWMAGDDTYCGQPTEEKRGSFCPYHRWAATQPRSTYATHQNLR